MSVADGIREKLIQAFAPIRLELIDESHKHAGHVGARPEGETHFRLEITSEQFAGLSKVARQRQVYAVLREEMAGPVHALSMSARTPAEDTAD